MQDFEKIYAEYFGEVYKFVLGLCQNVSLAYKPEMSLLFTQEI